VADEDRPTQPQPPADDPQFRAETERFDRPPVEERPADETAVMPPAGGPGEPPARWAARAGVPAGGPRQSAPQQWVPDQQPRTWWAPILIILAILVLIGLIALGLWVAVRTKSGPAPTPSAAPSSAAPSSPSPSPSPSASPSTSPTVTMVAVPSLRGVSLTDAEQILQSQGLNWKVTTRVSTEFPAGTVIETNPPATTLVPAGTEVTLVVATAPASPSPSRSKSSSPSLPA
jgi:PASTA domain